MNRRRGEIGPAPLAVAPDVPPLLLDGWSSIGTLGSLGEAIHTFTVRERHKNARPFIMLVMMNPQTVSVLRIVIMQENGDHRLARIDEVPGYIIDLAATRTRELFPRR